MSFQNRNASILCIFFIFFPLLNFCGNIYCAFSAWPLRREVCVPLSLPFVWISPIFLSRSLLWRGLSTALTGSPLIWISPLPDGLQTQSSSQVVLFVLEYFSCFLLPSSGSFCSLLQFCSTKFLRHGQCPGTLWSGWASGTALAGEFACTSTCRPFCSPSPGQFCSCSFVLPWKDYPKSFFGK